MGQLDLADLVSIWTSNTEFSDQSKFYFNTKLTEISRKSPMNSSTWSAFLITLKQVNLNTKSEETLKFKNKENDLLLA